MSFLKEAVATNHGSTLFTDGVDDAVKVLEEPAGHRVVVVGRWILLLPRRSRWISHLPQFEHSNRMPFQSNLGATNPRSYVGCTSQHFVSPKCLIHYTTKVNRV